MNTTIIYTTLLCYLTYIPRSLKHIHYTFNSLHQRTPLHNAAKGGYERTVECLVKEEADVNIKDNDGVGL